MISCAQDTAVVILSYNGKNWHEKFLPLILAESSAGYEVVVADNASTDDTFAYVKEHFPTAHTLHIPVNQGFTMGYKLALDQIQAKYYILLSADFEVTEGWFEPLLHCMHDTPGLAACMPKILYYRDRNKFEYAGAGGGFKDNFGYLFCRGRMFDTIEEDTGQYNDNIEIFWASGGCLMLRADLYHKIGGLDADMYAHMEEVDLCWRLKNAGYKIGYVGGSSVYHVGGSVISYGSAQKLFYNFRNSLVLLLKNETGSRLLWLLPLRMVLDGLAAIQFLFAGKFKEIGVILRAHISFYSHLGKWMKHRREAQEHITHRNESGIYKKSIVWQYFALGKKTFPKLKWRSERL